MVDGYTLASLVAFARNGVIVAEPITDILRDMIEVLKVIAKDLDATEKEEAQPMAVAVISSQIASVAAAAANAAKL